jgi:uncharacterized protein (TIGR02996 family)
VTREELETAILAAPHDVERRLVYADHLQAEGERLGELIALQIRTPEAAPAFIQRHRPALYGPLHAEIEAAESWAMNVNWRYGSIDSVDIHRIGDYLEVDVASKVGAFFDLPATRFIREVTLIDEYAGDWDDWNEEAARADETVVNLLDQAWHDIVGVLVERRGAVLHRLQFGRVTLGDMTVACLAGFASWLPRLQELVYPKGWFPAHWRASLVSAFPGVSLREGPP